MSQPDPKRVFIVYGRNTKAYEAMQLFLRSLKLDPLTFEEVKNNLGGSPFLGNIIRAGMEQAQAIVVLFTPDEYASLHPGLSATSDKPDDLNRWQPRPNVLLEAGMALAIDENRTILVVLGQKVTLASDLHGRHFIYLNDTTEARGKLRDALVGVGVDVDQKTSLWPSTAIAGQFDVCLESLLLSEVNPVSPFQRHETQTGEPPPIESFQVTILYEISQTEENGLSLEALCRQCVMKRTPMLHNLDILIERDFVFLDEDWTGQSKYALTPKARKLLHEMGFI